MCRFALIAVLFFVLPVWGTTYYVATNGNDSAGGTTTNAPFLTIGKATSVMIAGDNASIGPGEFNEFITNTVSGTAGNPITFHGTRDASGNWLTVIDPSVQLTTWTLAAGTSNGVYKATTPFTHAVTELTVGASKKRVPFVYSPGDITAHIGSIYTNSGITSGLQFLSTPANILLGGPHGIVSNVWDVLGACYASSNGVVYLRFKNGDDPNTMDIRGMDNNDIVTSANLVTKKAITFNASYVVYSNLWVRGAPSAFYLFQAVHNNAVVSNKITGCFTAIQLYGSASGPCPYSNSVIYNVTDGNRYGFNGSGAWVTSAGYTQANLDREMSYEFSKYLEGQNSTYDNALELYYCGNSNVISGNLFTNRWGNGLLIAGPVTNAASGTIISGNYFANQPSTGIFSQWSHINTLIFNNSFVDCDGCFRSGEGRPDVLNETNRSVYLFRNTFQEPNNWGDHLFANFQMVQTFFPTIWIYNNSFSGGQNLFASSSAAVTDGYIPNWHLVNNVGSGQYAWWGFASGYTTANVGDFAYNLVKTNANTASPSTITWIGANNIFISTDVWPNALGMSFALPVGSPGISSGLDVYNPFTLKAINYPALPNSSIIKAGVNWNIGALEGFNTSIATANSLHVQNLYSQ